MRRLLTSTLVLLAGCPSPSERSDSVPDPRLGVVVFETNDRPFSRAPLLATALANDGHVLQNRGRLAVAADGSVFVLIGLDAARPFGTPNDVTPSRVVVKKLSPGNVVSELPAPLLGSGGSSRNTGFVLAGDGEHPVIVDVHGADNPAGRYVAVTTFDGSAWKTVSFLRSDRAPSDLANTWRARDDQVRALRPGVVVVQHGDTLVRHDGTGWTPVTLPPRVKELRLGAADATRVRAYWLTADGALESDVLRDDGTWAGQVSRLKRGTAPSLLGAWGFAGDLDTFTVHYRAATDLLMARHEGGRFRLARSRPLAQGEADGTAFLARTRHPWRTAFVAHTGALVASYAGTETGPLGTVIGYLAGPAVTCEGDVTVGEGMVLAKDGARCVPRTLDALDFRLRDDVLELVELFADARQDATLRLYVKRIPLPSSVSDVTGSGVPDAGFPGDTGMVVTPGDRFIAQGRVLTPGAADHSGTTCVLLNKGFAGPIETVLTDVDGTVSFSPLPAGDYEAQCNRPQYQTHFASWPAGTLGEAPLQGVMVFGLLPPDDAPFPGAQDFELDGGTLFRRDDTSRTVLSTTVAAGDSVRLLAGQAVWKEQGGAMRTSVDQTIHPAPRAFSSFRAVGNTLVVAQGVPDGTTPLSWTGLPGAAVELSTFGALGGACAGTVVWTELAPGDVRATRGTCQVPITLVTSSQSVAPVPVLRNLSLAAGFAFGFVSQGACGEEGAFATPCALHTLDVLSGQPLSSTLLSSGALEARAQVVNGAGSRVVLLERSGATVTLKTTVFNSSLVEEVQAGFTLPTNWLAGESPVMFLGATSQRFLVRAADGVYVTLGTPGSWTKVASGARAVFEGGVVLLDDGSLLRVSSGGVAEPLPLRGSENLRVAASGLWSDAAEMSCPNGSTCRVLQRMTSDKVVSSLAAGRFVPDATVEPRRFGQPSARIFKARLEWPTKLVTVPP